MTILPSTACFSLEQGLAAKSLRAAELLPAELGERPGLIHDAEGHPIAYMAFLPEEVGLANLAALEEDSRRRALKACHEAILRSADMGIGTYAVAAGWSHESSALRALNVVGAPGSRQKAQSQLLRSLDKLATLADERGIRLAIRNMPPETEGMLSAPAEIRTVLSMLQAPQVNLYLDLDALELAALAKRADPEVAATGLADMVAYCRVAIAASWTQSFLSRHKALPIVFSRPVESVSALRDALLRLGEELQGVTPR